LGRENPFRVGVHHPVSASSNAVFLTPLQDGVYSLVAVDWDTGEELGKIILGDSPIYNTAGGLFIPLSEDKILITGVFGPVMIARPAK
jgi:hypothetical protein